MTTSLILPCYFATEALIDMTEACIESLNYERPTELIVIDDGSPLVMSPLEDADVWIRYPNNGGYTKAVNTGLEVAGGEVLVLGNNDIIFNPGWLSGLLKPLELGYDIASIVTSDQGWATRDEITEWDRFGCLWAMKRRVYDTIGSLDETLGNGIFSDTDYYLRAKEAGFRIGKNWAALVEHTGGATFNYVDPDFENFAKSQDRFNDKYGFII